MENYNQFLGKLPVDTWLSAMIWVLISLFVFKLAGIVFSNKVTMKTFSFKFWINANLLSVIFGFVTSLLILRLGDYAVPILEKFGYTLAITEDFVAWMIPVTWFIQWILEKYKKVPVIESVKDEMKSVNALFGTRPATKK